MLVFLGCFVLIVLLSLLEAAGVIKTTQCKCNCKCKGCNDEIF